MGSKERNAPERCTMFSKKYLHAVLKDFPWLWAVRSSWTNQTTIQVVSEGIGHYLTTTLEYPTNETWWMLVEFETNIIRVQQALQIRPQVRLDYVGRAAYVSCPHRYTIRYIAVSHPSSVTVIRVPKNSERTLDEMCASMCSSSH